MIFSTCCKENAMVFSSATFIFYFLPITILIYYLVPMKAKNGVLLLFSLFFYGFGEPVYILIMALSILIDYVNGLLIEKHRERKALSRVFLSVSVMANLGLLAFFKYGDFFITNMNEFSGSSIPLLNVALPIGISFFTFQTMSYSIDVYRGNTSAQKNIITFGAYVSMFPQLIAGPIVIYKDVEKQLTSRVMNVEKIREGILRFVLGLGKKVLLANSIGALWEEIRLMPQGELSVATAWLGITAFSLQIYFDFSGYSDMAIGLGKIFGFDFLENFDYPFISKSVTEFWRRWHMSLGKWFRDYLYIPLGGNRRGSLVTLRNIAVVWLLTGFWHGAAWNYVLWGGYFAAVLILEKFVLGKILPKMGDFMRRLYTIPVLLISFAVFALEDLTHLASYLEVMLGQGMLIDNTFLYHLSRYGVLLIILVLCSTPWPYTIFRKITLKNESFGRAVTGAVLALVFILSVSFIIDGAYNPFLYFRF